MAQQTVATLPSPLTTTRLSAGESLGRRAWRRFRRHRLAMISLYFLGVLILAAIAAPLITADPLQMDPRQSMAPPNVDHVLGTDVGGRDVWARLVYGTRFRWRWGWCRSRFRWRSRSCWGRWPAIMAARSIC